MTKPLVKKLWPGCPGTKTLGDRYGDALLCVRYRYDPNKMESVKTVELIVERRPWKPRKEVIPPNKKLLLQIRYEESYLQRLVKMAGGVWHRDKQAWELPFSQIQALGLEDRIIP